MQWFDDFTPNVADSALAVSDGTMQAIWDAQNVLLATDGGSVTQAHYTDFPGYWGGLVSQRRPRHSRGGQQPRGPGAPSGRRMTAR